MAQAAVTLKVSPRELQIIKAALAHYQYDMRRLKNGEQVHVPTDVFGNDPRKGILTIGKLIEEIGLV
jgi:hypothetical protein